MIFNRVKIAVLKIKSIQKTEKQKQYISENRKNAKEKKTPTKIKKGGMPPFGGERSCLIIWYDFNRITVELDLVKQVMIIERKTKNKTKTTSTK